MIDKRAYTQVYWFINEMSDELKCKIPDKIIQNIRNRMDKEYEFEIDGNIEDIELMKDAEKILSVLYTDYIATEEERKIIKNKEKLKKENKEAIKKIEIKEVFQEIRKEEKSLIEKKEEKWYEKFFRNIKQIWKNLIN